MKPLLQYKILTIIYVFIHTPVMVFAMDVLDYFNSGSTIGPVGYVAMSVALLAIAVIAMYFVVMFCIRICRSTT